MSTASTMPLTLVCKVPEIEVRNKTFFTNKTITPSTLYTNETFEASGSFCSNVVWQTIRQGPAWFGIMAAMQSTLCRSAFIGTVGIPESMACRVENGQATIVCCGAEWASAPCNTLADTIRLQVNVKDGVCSFYVNDEKVPCPRLDAMKLSGAYRVGVSMGALYQRGALVQQAGQAGVEEALRSGINEMPGGFGAFLQAVGSRSNGQESVQQILASVAALRAAHGDVDDNEQGEDDADEEEWEDEDDDDEEEWEDEDDDDEDEGTTVVAHAAAPPVSPTSFTVDPSCSIVRSQNGVFTCHAPQDGTVYVPVSAEVVTVSVRFTGISTGYVGCGFFKKAALDAGDATEYLLGKTQHSIGCLLKNGEVFVFLNDKPVFCGDTRKADELTMHLSFDRKKGMNVRIEKGNVSCDEFKDMSLFAGDLYFGISMSEEGQSATLIA